MPSFIAFVHHVAAFALVAALAVEFMLMRDELSMKSARRLQAADAVYGIAAGVLLAAGFARVLWFEKGAAYYFASVPFIAKLSLFVLVGLLSIVPTVEFLSWRAGLKRGEVPVLAEAKKRRLRAIIHAELGCVVLILLCAALMAKGVGYLG
ncbi:MAG: DUF2214 family protein [Burkholderiales bacterium]